VHPVDPYPDDPKQLVMDLSLENAVPAFPWHVIPSKVPAGAEKFCPPQHSADLSVLRLQQKLSPQHRFPILAYDKEAIMENAKTF
jgi:hypothetical protein